MKSAKHKFFLVAVFCSAIFFSFAQNIPAKPEPGRPVNDFANLLSENEEALLDKKLRDYNDSTSTQIVIVTVESLEGAPAAEYAATIGEKWGVGQKDKHNGIVLLVSKTDRKGYIATGYGVEDGLNTNVCHKIYQNIMVPNFRAGNFYAAFDEATDKIFQVLNGKFEGLEDKSDGKQISKGAIVLIIVLIIIFILIMRRGNRGQQFSRGGSSLLGPILFGGGGFGGGGFGGGGSSSSGSSFDFGGGGFSGGGSGGDW